MCLNNQPDKQLDLNETSQNSMFDDSNVGGRSVRVDDGSVAALALKNDLLRKCQNIYRVRRAREAMFDGSDIFCDPAWDILLDLFAGHLQGRQISVTSSGLAAYAPITTALRWLSVLEKDGYVQRQYDPADRRRMFVSLTERAIANMTKILEQS